MKYLNKVAATIALAAATAAVPASAAERLFNGDFEAGSFSGWIQGGNTGFTTVTSGAANTGAFGAELGPIGSIGTLSQTFGTVVGGNYDISFDLLQNGGAPSLFRVIFDGQTIYTTSSSTQPGTYSTFNGFTVAASSALTTLLIEFRQDPDFYFLDNVSVQGPSVPEPGTWALMLVGFGAVGTAMRSRSRRRSTKVSFA